MFEIVHFRLKRELKHEKELAAFPLTSSTAAASSSSKTTRCIEAIRAKVDEITRKMETNRTNKKRPFDLQVWVALYFLFVFVCMYNVSVCAFVSAFGCKLYLCLKEKKLCAHHDSVRGMYVCM